MKLNNIILKNYRCFADLSINFHPEMTVLVAPNGGGKTTIIDAARIAVWPFIKAFDLGSQFGKSASIQLEDVRLRQQGNDMEAVTPCVITAKGYWPTETAEKTWSQSREQIKSRTNTLPDADTKKLTRLGKKLQQQVRDEQHKDPINLPLVAYLGTGRLWYQGRHTSEVADKQLDNSMYSRLWGYHNCLTASSSYKQFEDWYGWIYKSYRELQTLQLEQSEYFNPQQLATFAAAISVVKQAVNALTEQATGWKDLEYRASQNRQLVMHYPKLGTLPLSALSDGIRNIVVLVSEIAFRCIKLNPHFGAQAARQTSGIVMIDEVDMFLHPAWQQTVIASLQHAFPKLQFIITTHSPQVLSTVNAESICIINEAEVYKAPKGSKGAESSRILKRIFGVDARPISDENTQLLLAYEQLVYKDEWKTEKAKMMRIKLDEIFSGEEPKLTALDLYIENREWEISLEENQ